MTRRNKYKRDRYGHIVRKVDKETNGGVAISNPFEALQEEEETDKCNAKTIKQGKENTK